MIDEDLMSKVARLRQMGLSELQCGGLTLKFEGVILPAPKADLDNLSDEDREEIARDYLKQKGASIEDDLLGPP